ncbi:unnamed protein product [Fusarium graminearum]|nr:unnamed protein product [Fusarium graminearum]
MSVQYPTPSYVPPLHIFVDDSNIAIGGRKLYYPQGTRSRTRWNYDIGVLSRIIISRFSVNATQPFVPQFLNFYGSDLRRSPQLNHRRAVGAVFCHHCPRTRGRQEKQADVGLAVDMTEQVIQHALPFKFPCNFVLVSGDGDFIPAVRKALEYGFNVHVWSWRASLSLSYIRLKNQFDKRGQGKLRIHILDRHLNALTRSP